MFEENERRGVSGQARQDVGRVSGKRQCAGSFGAAGADSALGFADGRDSGGGGRLMRSGLIKKRLSAEVGEAMGLLRNVSTACLITK